MQDPGPRISSRCSVPSSFDTLAAYRSSLNPSASPPYPTEKVFTRRRVFPHQRDEGRRIDPPGEERPDLHVALHAEQDGFLQHAGQRPDGFRYGSEPSRRTPNSQ